MQDKVVPFNQFVSVPDATGKPVPEIIAFLRQSLEEAERGELQGCALIAVTGSGNFSMRWHAACNAGSMLGASTLLHETIKNAYIENVLLSCQDETPPDEEA